MRNIYKLSVAALALLASVSCNNEAMNEVIDNQIPEHGYIFFNTDVDSRGALIEDRLEDDFGVMGYTYLGTWESNVSMATPNVFSEQEVEWNANNEIHTYEPHKQWLGGLQMYSFFAYYPYGLETSGDAEGVPYTVYTLDCSNSANHVDVMTAKVIDTNASTGSYVNFNMEHRLAAIDVVARNFNNKANNIVISDLSISFSNLLYNKVTIPLDGSELVGSNTRNNTTASFPMFSGAEKNIPYGDEEYTNLTTDNNRMIIIPQDTPLAGTINISYKAGSESTTKSVALPADREVQSGHRYYIQLTFTTEDVTIALVETEQWIDIEDINHEFE